MRRYLLGGLVAAAVMIAGCGDTNIVPVSGRVALDGKPLGGATVNFQPDEPGKAYPGPGSMAVTRDDGGYTMKLVGKPGDGAVIGKHKVYITKSSGVSKPDEDRAAPEILPSKYNGKSTLTFDVPAGGTQSADFTLTSK